MSQLPVRLTIDLEPGAEPIQGLVSQDGRPARSFTGWLELSTALELARTADNRSGDPKNPRILP